jgi:hypothetical protein
MLAYNYIKREKLVCKKSKRPCIFYIRGIINVSITLLVRRGVRMFHFVVILIGLPVPFASTETKWKSLTKNSTAIRQK